MITVRIASVNDYSLSEDEALHVVREYIEEEILIGGDVEGDDLVGYKAYPLGKASKLQKTAHAFLEELRKKHDW